MQIPNPQTKKLVQLNNSNVLGDLWATFNIDLNENEGLIRLGKRLIINTNTSDVAEITSYPSGFHLFGGSKFAVAGASGTGYVFKNSTTYPSATLFSKVTGANTPATIDSNLSDIIVSNSNMYVSAASNSVYWTTDGSTWSTAFTVGASDSGSTHMMCAFGARTYMTKLGSSIQSWDSSNTVASLGSQYTLQLGNTSSNYITFIRAASNRIWIGTVNTLGGKGYIYEWDGSATQTQKSYRLESQGALACVIKDDIPYVMDTNGALIVFNGGTFKKLTQLNRRRNRLLWNPTSSVNNRFIHPNGMSLVNGKINLLVDGRNYDGSTTGALLEETISSGVYEYDENKGLIHKQSIGLSRVAGTITDLGQARVAGVGALSEFNIADNTSGRDGTFLAGATYFTSATASTSGIFFDNMLDNEKKGGWFITSKLRPEASKLGPTITGLWKKFYITYRKFLSSTDRIVVKYRYIEQEPTTVSITWSSSTQFTTADANMANYAVGDEVEIIQGAGGGFCSHITVISNNAGTYTVTVDETHTSASGTALARLQKWIKVLEVNDQTSTWAQGGFPGPGGMPIASSWIQLKVWAVFTGQDEVENLYPADLPSQIAQ